MEHSRVITIRPSFGKAGKSALRRFTPLAIVAVLLQFYLAGQSGGKDSPLEAIPILMLVGAVVADFTYRMTTVVVVTMEQVTIRSWLTFPHVVPRSQIGGVALRRVYSYPIGSRSYAVIVGDGGRSIATLPEGIWKDDDIRSLQVALGSKDHSYRQVTSDEYKREFPGAVHTYWGWIFAALVMVVMFAGIYLQSR